MCFVQPAGLDKCNRITVYVIPRDIGLCNDATSTVDVPSNGMIKCFKEAQTIPIKYTEVTKKRVEFSIEASHRFRIQNKSILITV